MKDEFLKKLYKKEYISTRLYEYIKENYKKLIPEEFNIDNYNEIILNREYLKYKDYFDNMYKGIDDKIRLDENQAKAILADEDYSLIIAGAGTGKTTTMASKVKYLVDIKKIDPEKIVVMSYTKKATEELKNRIIVDFEIPANVMTFHSLGMKYIREIFQDKTCYIIDDNTRDKIFYNYFKEKIFPNKNKLKEILNIFNINKGIYKSNFILGKHFLENYDKFDNYDDYFEYYKKCKLKECKNLKETINSIIEKRLNREEPVTINNELVKSKGEALIANFLYANNIDYYYEKVYKETMEENRTYRPDFTLELAGEEVYIEYFGLSNYKDDELNTYNKIRKIKEDYHKKHHTKFIKLDYQRGENLGKTLANELRKFGFKLRPKTNEEIFYALLDSNPLAPIFSYKSFTYNIIDLIKASPNRKNYNLTIQNYISKLDDETKEIASIQYKYINDFYKYYQRQLFGGKSYGFDFSDMIYYANQYVDTVGENNEFNFEYLIIDEYQDISRDRYEFTKNIVERNKAKVVAVGDDWQSIFSFAGSKIKYIYNFQKYFKGAKLLKINNTYRNSQELINYSGSFIMKNDWQIKKQLVSNKNISNPIKFVGFSEDNEYKVLKKLILKIYKEHPNHKILVLARTNAMIKRCYEDPELKDGIGTKIEFVGNKDISIDGMTIHKSKGLTFDEVIVIGLNKNFPNENRTTFWLESIFKPKLDKEGIPFAEERRLFYVALTRTKNNVYLLVNKNPELRSPFINEIHTIIKNVNDRLKLMQK